MKLSELVIMINNIHIFCEFKIVKKIVLVNLFKNKIKL